MKTIIPDGNDFYYFFSTIENEVDEIDDTYIEIIINEESTALLSNDENIKIERKKIYIKKDNKIPLNSIIKRIQTHFIELNHCNTEKMAMIILYLYTFFPRKNDCIKIINEMLDWNTTADLNQIVIFNMPNLTNYNLNFGEFSFGSLNFDRLKRNCEKIKTDFAQLYGNKLENKISIERTYFTIPVLDLVRIFNYSVEYSGKLNEGFYIYYEELSYYYQNDFEYKFTEQQNLMTLLNDDFIDINQWKLLFQPYNISLFLNISKLKNGWIIPKGNGGINIDFASSDKKYNVLKNELSYNYGLKDFLNNELHHTIENYLSFCSKAKRYKKVDLINESFLHFIIALDLIFGERNSSTNSVTTRVSICTFKTLKKSYKENIKLIEELYDIRSRYVHGGKSVKIDDIILAEKICIEILYVFLRINKKNNDWKRDSWVKKLDLLVAHVNADEIPSEEKYEELGIK
jgi:hypothetical protein